MDQDDLFVPEERKNENRVRDHSSKQCWSSAGAQEKELNDYNYKRKKQKNCYLHKEPFMNSEIFFFFFFNIVGVSPQSPLNGLSQLIVTQHQTEIMTLLKETPTEPTV